MEATATIDVDRPIADVWTFVADVENMDEWVVGMSDTHRVNDEGGVGARYEGEYAYNGRSVTMVYEVTTFEPPTRHTVRSVDGPFPFEGTLTLEEMPTGTRVTNAIAVGTDCRATAVLFTVFRPLMRRFMAGQIRDELETLKRRAEAEPVPA